MILNFIKMKDDLIFPSRPLKSSSSDSGGYVKEGVHQKIKNFNQLQFCLHNQPLGLLSPKTFSFSAGWILNHNLSGLLLKYDGAKS